MQGCTDATREREIDEKQKCVRSERRKRLWLPGRERVRARGQGAKRVRENDSMDMEQDEPRRDSGAASTKRALGTEHETRGARGRRMIHV